MAGSVPIHPGRRRARRAAVTAGAVMALVLGSSPEVLAAPPAPESTPQPAPAAAAALPALQVTELITGLNQPWDLTFTPDGTMIYNQKSGPVRARLTNGTTRPVSMNQDDLWVSGETGLMGMVVDPGFRTNRYFYTCQGWESGDNHDVRVIKWQMNAGYTGASRVGNPILTGIGATSGRHGGCRLRFDRNGLLYIGTGDAAVGTWPQDREVLNGKVLRITTTGAAAPGNPYYNSSNAVTRRIFTYGHRNVQGLALRPGTNEMWSVEQGTGRDDEVNKLGAGRNYGYNPVPGYNESVPMTDLSLPNATAAVYTTGDPTLALSGGTWLTGAQWGSLDGAFVAAALKDTSLRALTITAAGTLVSQQSIPQLDNSYGRLRSPQLGPDGALYVTTSDGDGQDQILRVVPQRTTGDSSCLGSRTSPTAPVGAVRTATGYYAFVVATDRTVRYKNVDLAGAFVNLGAQVIYGPSATSWDNQRIDLFAIAGDRSVLHRWRIGSTWSAWENLGFKAYSAPAAMSTGDRRLNVFARGADGALWMKRFDGSAWSAWTKLGGGLSGSPGALSGTNARVGFRHPNGKLYEMTFGANGLPSSGFVDRGFGICTAPGYSGSGAYLARSYVRSDRTVDVGKNGMNYGLRGGITGAVALTTGTSAYGFAAFGRGTNGALYMVDARTGVPGVGWRSLGGNLLQ
ncbi:hypothetical protein GIS00_06095 [Nakamurella sp. YIM 132087]|uniref:PQQ-dependent sugar dehydrogenase n=1 Tax=Nakamurella alba TaxID=2665158 RepID=A0A7K1FKW4_9ACTN|nr:PQQ-dependent sugar dehydrogenase [Nakamurella alba]MTD13514.1 hypothetical protein [Nakamurella alba]